MSLEGQREYEVTVETPRESHTVTVWPNQHVQAVVAEVLAREGVVNNIEAYQLVHDGDPLVPLNLVRSAGVVEGDTLHLEPNPAGGI